MIAKMARIEWMPRDRGGRTAPAVGPRYTAPAKFLPNAASCTDEAWSLVVALIDRPRGPCEWLARIHLLVDEAPHHLIADGADFELYEGKKCVARGRVGSREGGNGIAADEATAPGSEAVQGPGR